MFYIRKRNCGQDNPETCVRNCNHQIPRPTHETPHHAGNMLHGHWHGQDSGHRSREGPQSRSELKLTIDILLSRMKGEKGEEFKDRRTGNGCAGSVMSMLENYYIIVFEQDRAVLLIDHVLKKMS